MHEVSTSRRAVMCALAIAPAVIATTGVASAATGEFDAALAEYHHARAEFERIIKLGDDDASRIAGTVSDEAFAKMLAAPSENLGDIAVKLETFLFEYDDCEMDGQRFALIAQDARRLAGRA